MGKGSKTVKTITSASLSGAADLIRHYDLDGATIAQLAGLDPKALIDPDMILDSRQVLRFFNLASAACRDRYFGIELAYHQGPEILGSVWLLAKQAATLGQALNNVSEAMQLYSNAIVMRLLPEENGAACFYDTLTGRDTESLDGEEQVVELSFAMLCNEVRLLAGPAWVPSYVQFRHAAPPSLRRHQKEFGHSLLFNQNRNAIFLDDRTLALRMRGSQAGQKILQRELLRRRKISRESFPSRVELVIRSLMSAEQCTVSAVADTLDVSVRSLQIKLATTGTSYQKILDHVRENLGCRYLRDSDLSVAEIAELLQFSETSTFSRFFRERKKMSPRAFKKAESFSA
ncbi:MAG: AraC-like DNA-binding protein [Bermanella sp.]